MQVAVACIGIICAAAVIAISKPGDDNNAQANGSNRGEYHNMREKKTAEPTDAFGRKISVEDLEGKSREDIEEILYPPSTITCNAEEIDNDPTSLYVLVNKENPVRQNYKPDDLVEPQVEFNFDKEDEKRYMRAEAAAALEGMFAQADEEGCHLQAVSGYRSFLRQTILYKNNLKYHGLEYTSLYSAMPGKSEHQTGWAMDITCDSVGNELSIDFGDCPEGQWVNDNCYKFGFIIRYPRDTEDITGYAYEPWHLRYVGYNLARYLRDEGITLDEYYGYVLDKEATQAQEIEYYEKNIGRISAETPDPDIILDIPDLEKDLLSQTYDPIQSGKPDGENKEGEGEPKDSQPPEKSEKPDVSGKPDNSEAPLNSEDPEKTTKPEDKPKNTDTPGTSEPEGTGKPDATKKPENSGKPNKTDKPENTGKPGNTDKPDNSGKPDNTQGPEETGKTETTKPSDTGKPEVTDGPENTKSPETTAAPATLQPTGAPAASNKPDDGKPTQPPKETETPVATKEPEGTGQE